MFRGYLISRNSRKNIPAKISTPKVYIILTFDVKINGIYMRHSKCNIRIIFLEQSVLKIPEISAKPNLEN